MAARTNRDELPNGAADEADPDFVAQSLRGTLAAPGLTNKPMRWQLDSAERERRAADGTTKRPSGH
jgi:hypothetical protein